MTSRWPTQLNSKIFSIFFCFIICLCFFPLQVFTHILCFPVLCFVGVLCANVCVCVYIYLCFLGFFFGSSFFSLWLFCPILVCSYFSFLLFFKYIHLFSNESKQKKNISGHGAYSNNIKQSKSTGNALTL